jgi:hypothetical protein
MSNFVFFDATQARTNDLPRIAIRRGGVIVMNVSAVKMLANGNGDDEVLHVKVGYDAKRKAIGIAAASAKDSGRFRLRKQKKGLSRTINAKRLFDHYSLAVEKATSYDVEDFGDGIFGVTLRPSITPSESNSAGTGKRKARA